MKIGSESVFLCSFPPEGVLERQGPRGAGCKVDWKRVCVTRGTFLDLLFFSPLLRKLSQGDKAKE